MKDILNAGSVAQVKTHIVEGTETKRPRDGVATKELKKEHCEDECGTNIYKDKGIFSSVWGAMAVLSTTLGLAGEDEITENRDTSSSSPKNVALRKGEGDATITVMDDRSDTSTDLHSEYSSSTTGDDDSSPPKTVIDGWMDYASDMIFPEKGEVRFQSVR